MAKHLMAVYSNAHPGRDADYMHWYETVHLAEVCTIPGVVGGRVFEALPASPAQPAGTYLALYDLDVDNPLSVLQELGRRREAGELSGTDAVDPSSARIQLLKQNF